MEIAQGQKSSKRIRIMWWEEERHQNVPLAEEITIETESELYGAKNARASDELVFFHRKKSQKVKSPLRHETDYYVWRVCKCLLDG